jgi:hypothetical protein
VSSDGAVLAPALQPIIRGRLSFRAKYLDSLRESKYAVEEPAVPMLDQIPAALLCICSSCSAVSQPAQILHNLLLAPIYFADEFAPDHAVAIDDVSLRNFERAILRRDGSNHPGISFLARLAHR